MIIVLFMTFIYICCHNEKKNEKKIIENMNQSQKEYYLNQKFGNFNYEIYINDILISSSISGNGTPGPYEINPYIFSSGNQKLRIKISAPTELGKEYLAPKDITDFQGKTFISLLENENFDNVKIIKEINFPPINSKVPFIEQEWIFEAEAIDGIDNLNKSQDLTKIDKEKLQQEVVVKYEQLKNLLNQGDGKTIVNEIEKPMLNILNSEYVPEQERLEYKTNLEKYFDSHKGTLPSIGNFTLRIMGNGRAVALEYVSGKYKGLGILSSEDTANNTLNKNYFILHKPIGSNNFEIFTYNCSYTNLK